MHEWSQTPWKKSRWTWGSSAMFSWNHEYTLFPGIHLTSVGFDCVNIYKSYRHLCVSISKILGSPAACPASLQALTSLLQLGTARVLKASGFARKCREALTMIKSRLFRLRQLPDPSPGKGAQCIKHIHTALCTFASVRIWSQKQNYGEWWRISNYYRDQTLNCREAGEGVYNWG